MFTETEYMDIKDVQLAAPLLSVKRSGNENDTLVVPDTVLPQMLRFFCRDKIACHVIENPGLYPQDQLKAGMQRYIDIDGSLDEDNPVLLITPFDKDALFEWSKQTFGETMDPSYRAYFDSERRRGEDYYYNLYEYRP